MSEQDADAATRQPARGDEDPSLHDMGGAIGPASIRGSGARPGGNPDDDAEPRAGFAREAGPVAGLDEDSPPTAGTAESGVAAPVTERPVPGSSPYVAIDEGGDNVGRGADGDSAARLEQEEAGGP